MENAQTHAPKTDRVVALSEDERSRITEMMWEFRAGLIVLCLAAETAEGRTTELSNDFASAVRDLTHAMKRHLMDAINLLGDIQSKEVPN